MSSDILEILQNKSHTFSKGQRMIAKYISESYDKAAFMTASKLGKTVGVSESTVVRFAVELGYDGYPTMQKAIQEMVLNRLTSVQRLEVAHDRIGDRDLVSLVLQSDIEKLRQTDETVSREDFNSCAPLASFLGYSLNLVSANVHTATPTGEGAMFEKIVGVKSHDAVIALSFPRYSTAVVQAAQYCRSAGAAVIGITDNPQSPLGQNADYVLAAKSDMVSLVDSLVAPLSVMNALIVAVAANREERLAATFTALENIWDQYNVYEKQVGSHGV